MFHDEQGATPMLIKIETHTHHANYPFCINHGNIWVMCLRLMWCHAFELVQYLAHGMNLPEIKVYLRAWAKHHFGLKHASLLARGLQQKMKWGHSLLVLRWKFEIITLDISKWNHSLHVFNVSVWQFVMFECLYPHSDSWSERWKRLYTSTAFKNNPDFSLPIRV